jgi:hypothetical protein
MFRVCRSCFLDENPIQAKRGVVTLSIVPRNDVDPALVLEMSPDATVDELFAKVATMYHSNVDEIGLATTPQTQRSVGGSHPIATLLEVREHMGKRLRECGLQHNTTVELYHRLLPPVGSRLVLVKSAGDTGTCVVPVLPGATVYTLQVAVFRLVGIPVDQQRIVWGGQAWEGYQQIPDDMEVVSLLAGSFKGSHGA